MQARKHNKQRAEAIRILLDAAAYLRDGNFPVNFNVSRAIKILLDCSVGTLANPIYMGYGLRIDRDHHGHIELLPESHYYTAENGDLIRVTP